MRKILNNKKALSELIAYVLLVGIALSMSVFVYSWMKFRVEKPFAEEDCPDTVSLVLVSYTCSANVMNVTVQNKGMFDIYGYSIKSSDVEIGLAGKSSFDLFKKDGESGDNIIEFISALKGNARNSTLFSYAKNIKQIEIEPYILKEGETDKTFCKNAVVTSKTSGCNVV